MKLKVFALFAALMCFFSVTAFAATLKDVDISLSLGEEYFVITENSVKENAEIIENLGYSKSSFKELFTKGSLVAFILHADTKTQIQIRVNETEFAKELSDLYLLEGDNLWSVAQKLSASAEKTVTLGDTVFVKSVNQIKDEAGQYNVSQYITVKNGRLYTFSFYSPAPNADFERQTLSLTPIKTDKPKASLSEILLLILMTILIIGFIVLAGFLIFPLLAQVKPKEDNDVREFVRIKRRKF